MKKVLICINVISTVLIIAFMFSAFILIRSIVLNINSGNEITHIATIVPVIFLLIGFIAAAYILVTLKKKSEIVIIIRIFFAVILLFVVYATFGVPRRIRNAIQVSKPLNGNVNVIIKNRATVDKKYYWLDLNIQWKIDKINKSDVKVDILHTKKMINYRIDWETKPAVFKAMWGIPSNEIGDKIEQIEEKISHELKEAMHAKASYQSDFNIVVTILKYRTLDNKYEGRRFPPPQ